ncbi:uncharacterized protein LOC120186741 [Hibiscus syriacus]|uniref:uncharacterized protein LOC120186741 n=1 Tax=Hibiscus syriacus TaxID=106335 RepID=UPI001924CE03|nr:uncharacterized protein LOC120186741 [Hibiscus syriacus]
MDTIRMIKQYGISSAQRTILAHISALLQQNWTVDLQHVNRERNKVADAMTKVARQQDLELTWFLNPPTVIRSLLPRGEAHLELFPTPEPTPAKDPDKRKKKKKNQSSKFKRKKEGPKDPNNGYKKWIRKHPLRVPGMRPGESCYICKANDHIAKLCPQKAQWEKHMICLHCRQRGHCLKNCPDVMDKKTCYNCGETGHSLSKCPQPLQDGGTKFAQCFVCKEIGHLSKNCPKNTHGIYPKGGCCKICGGVTHLAKDCPDKGKRAFSAANGEDTCKIFNYQSWGFIPNVLLFVWNNSCNCNLNLPRMKPAVLLQVLYQLVNFSKYSVPQDKLLLFEDKMVMQVTKFVSGDELEDDFVTQQSTNNASDAKINSEKQQGPEYLDFPLTPALVIVFLCLVLLGIALGILLFPLNSLLNIELNEFFQE